MSPFFGKNTWLGSEPVPFWNRLSAAMRATTAALQAVGNQKKNPRTGIDGPARQATARHFVSLAGDSQLEPDRSVAGKLDLVDRPPPVQRSIEIQHTRHQDGSGLGRAGQGSHAGHLDLAIHDPDPNKLFFVVHHACLLDGRPGMGSSLPQNACRKSTSSRHSPVSRCGIRISPGPPPIMPRGKSADFRETTRILAPRAEFSYKPLRFPAHAGPVVTNCLPRIIRKPGVFAADGEILTRSASEGDVLCRPRLRFGLV